MINRRSLLKLGGAAALVFTTQKGFAMGWFGSSESAGKDFPYQLSDAEWRERLSEEAYYVLRQHGTERARTSPLNNEHRTGVYHCAGCGHPLYPSNTKYESGTGWPSFFAPVNDAAVGTSTDYKLIYPRTEVHCANCGGHLGHVFEDGPEPTGLRHCINGVALEFRPAEG